MYLLRPANVPSIKRLTKKSLFIAAIASGALLVATGIASVIALSTGGQVTVVPSAATASVITVEGIDLHDGTVAKFGNTYYLYGTMYGCGYHWRQNSPWCGFGVSTAPSLMGPWSAPTQLFSPASWNSYAKMSWNSECGVSGAGCFNPRMVQRTWGPNDGVYILWFNAPADYSRNGANAYYAMGCNGPAGPCGDAAGPPYGSTHKPAMYKCSGNGDFSIVMNGSDPPQMLCTMANQTFASEQLNYWGVDGNNVGSTNLAGLTNVESPGAYRDPATGTWVLTYSDRNCGYCTGTGTGYATASGLTGVWTAPTSKGYDAPVASRRLLSATSCGGQPRTVFEVDNQAYQFIDLWGQWSGDSSNQAGAGLLFAPLEYTPKPAANGKILPPQFMQWPCS